MKLTSDHSNFQNNRFTRFQPQNLYRGNAERIADKFTPEQIEMMIAVEYVVKDMEKVQRGRDVVDYELNILVANREEYDFAFTEIKNVMRLHRDADPAFDASNWEVKQDMPGDSFRYWVCRADESYIGINVKWSLPDVGTQARINETKKIAAQAYA